MFFHESWVDSASSSLSSSSSCVFFFFSFPSSLQRSLCGRGASTFSKGWDFVVVVLPVFLLFVKTNGLKRFCFWMKQIFCAEGKMLFSYERSSCPQTVYSAEVLLLVSVCWVILGTVYGHQNSANFGAGIVLCGRREASVDPKQFKHICLYKCLWLTRRLLVACRMSPGA